MSKNLNPEGIICSGCGNNMGSSMLSCPNCHHLVYADQLKQISREAQKKESSNDIIGALSDWREALTLLPEDTKQYAAIHARIGEFSRRINNDPAFRYTTEQNNPSAASGKNMLKSMAGLGAAGLFFWKFKFIFAFLITKGKLLLLGLTKAGTLFSMLAAFSLYWTIWGWKFALGLVVSIYIHEMGHVAALRRYGIHATAPLFIPGVGAVVRLKQIPTTPMENARVGLAGPLWGLGAAVASWLLYVITNLSVFAAIARIGAWINLFNLLPLLPLDGGRGFQALNSSQRWIAVAAIGIAWFLTGEGLLILLLITGGIYAFSKHANPDPDPVALVQYIGLLAALTWISRLPVPA